MAIEREEWNQIRDMILRLLPSKTLTFGKVIQNDPIKRLVWLSEFGSTPIPLVSFEFGFAYYDTRLTTDPVQHFAGPFPIDVTTKLVKREDKTDKDPAYKVHVITPSVGDQVAVLTPWGNQRFPICIGKILSKAGYWEGEE